MIQKKKICVGFNGVEHEDYIYKNIDGKKYCKSCTMKLQPPKSINKVSKKNSENFKFKIKLKQDQYQKDSLFYNSIWIKEFYSILSDGEVMMVKSPRCWHCSRRLGEEPNLMFFHHILEKRNFPQFRYLEENIVILCPDCHNGYETFPDKLPKIQKLRENLLNKLVN